MNEKTYLGYSVYVEILLDGDVLLTSDDGDQMNEICLEPPMLKAFHEFIEQSRVKIAIGSKATSIEDDDARDDTEARGDRERGEVSP